MLNEALGSVFGVMEEATQTVWSDEATQHPSVLKTS